MSRLRKKLTRGDFVTTAEIAPPKGVDVDTALRTAEKLISADAINVTDNQGACMRMAPLALARLLIEKGYEPILQMTCRDRNRMALQSDLLGAAALGIKNLLLLTGDHPGFGDHRSARPVFDLDSVQLINGSTTLQSGRDMSGNELDSAPLFFVGAAAAPTAEPQELILMKIARKVDSGAAFFQTQAVFHRTQIESFMQAVNLSHQVPILLGVLLLKGPRMARYLNCKVPGVHVPDDVIERLDAAVDPLEEGVAIAREMVAWARDLCHGVHLMTFGREDLIPRILAD